LRNAPDTIYNSIHQSTASKKVNSLIETPIIAPVHPHINRTKRDSGCAFLLNKNAPVRLIAAKRIAAKMAPPRIARIGSGNLKNERMSGTVVRAAKNAQE